MTKSILFNTKGHDDFLDFIKAYSILCVLFGHTFPFLDIVGYNIWAGMQVPLFILIQSFHFYKKDNNSICFRKVFKRVLIPFLLVEIVTFLLALLVGVGDREFLLNTLLKKGGYGPGSYYPYIYVQIALFLPAFSFIIKRTSNLITILFFLIFCEGFEVFFSYVDFPDSIYRLLAVRYIFLLYLGWKWVKEGIKINSLMLLLSVISLAAIVYFDYYSIDDEPLFYNTAWKCHRWPCYFFVANGFTAFLYMFWGSIKNNKFICKIVGFLSCSSYEIFLVQMSLIFLLNYEDLFFIENSSIRYLCWMMIIWFLSILGGILLNKFFNKKSVRLTKVI